MQLLKKFPLSIVMSLFLFSLIGCGEKTVVVSGTKSEQSDSCIGCHQSAVSPVGTGKTIVEEWKLSHHNTSNAAGCADCHEPEHAHPRLCLDCHGGTSPATTVTKNPDESKKCDKCHGSANGLFPTGSKRAHYGEPTASVRYVGFAGYTASYISTNYIGKCRKCHNPHDPTSNIEFNRTWAKSGHGDVAANARRSREFRTQGTTQPASEVMGASYCVRCHTTTGFIQFVDPGPGLPHFTNVNPFGAAADKTKEVTGCDACHSGYNFKVRDIGQVKIYYNYSASTSVRAKLKNSKTFPDLGSSNICIPCHAGRGTGSEIELLSATAGVDFALVKALPSTHTLNGAGLLTAQNGYEFKDSSGVKKNYITGFVGVAGHEATGLSSGKGPCITCHMSKTAKSDSHTFKPIIHDSTQFDLYSTNSTWAKVYSVSGTGLGSFKVKEITSQSCNTSGCHAGSLPNITAADLNIDKEGYISALAALNQWVRLVRNVPVNAQTTPVCVDTTNAPRLLTKWNYFGSGPDLMGAAYNLSILNAEPGAYVHNPLYAKRLIYDSIYYLMGAESKTNVANAIQFLVGSTRLYYTAKTGITAGVSLLCTDYTASKVSITQHQADAAIKWLYGSITPADKSKRPGDI